MNKYNQGKTGFVSFKNFNSKMQILVQIFK